MIYKDFQGLKLSQLGFGTMRLPLREDKSIDAEQAAAMTSEAIAKGVTILIPPGRITAARRNSSSAKF